MVSPNQVSEMIKASLPDAEVAVEDLTGGGDHYQVTVVSSKFEGLTLVKQHQLVYGAVRDAMSSEAIHALALKTYTPADWTAAKNCLRLHQVQLKIGSFLDKTPLLGLAKVEYFATVGQSSVRD